MGRIGSILLRSSRATTACTYAVLGIAAAVSFILPAKLLDQAKAYTPPQTIRVPGIVRDFRKNNAEFNSPPSAGNGHYAGNISPQLGNDDRPTFIGAGYRVTAQWRDKNIHPIAPHMYMFNYGSPGKIPVAQATSSPAHGLLDTYNSAAGPYGGANVGPAPVYEVGAPMPVVAIPRMLSGKPNQGNLTWTGPLTVNTSVHCNQLTINGTITINGNVSILCEGQLLLNSNAAITLQANARLNLYLRQGGSSWNHVVVGASSKPSRTTIYNLGTADFLIHNHADVYATMVSPNARLVLNNHGALFGRFVGKTIAYDNHGDFHVDSAAPLDLCGVVVADTAGTAGANSTGGIPSASAFGTWFTDVMGKNLSTRFDMVMTRNGSGVYEYVSDNFFPADGQLFGNESEAHNYFFTYAFDVDFTHHSCDGRFIEFQGCDDAWMFIDGMLVMDLGGVIPGTAQYVDLDRLGLADGQRYRLHFFHAQRNTAMSVFRMRTTMDLIDQPLTYTISGGMD